MPGKYPLIESPPSERTSIVSGPAPDGLAEGTVLSRSSKNGLAAMFPNSPIYTYSDQTYRQFAQTLLMPDAQIGDPAHFPAPVDMNYAGSPDLSDASSGPLSLGFDSPYYPNLIANPDPAGGEGTATGVPLSPNDNFGTGSPVTEVIPSATAAIISQTTVEAFGPIAPAGQSGANLASGGTVTTHTINDGAVPYTP